MSKKIQDKYKILDPISHVLLRPQTYIGSNKLTTKENWVVNKDCIVKEEVSYIPSFIKIFDEVITNSIDESKRKGSKLNTIKVDVSPKDNSITIWDNGGIPVIKHKEYKMYIPEVVFGNLMSGSNYDDTEDRTLAGLNGLGVKLTNIYSTELKLSSCDGKKSFKQVYSNNMRDRTKPVVKKAKKNHTEVKYYPDLEKFGLKEIDKDHFKIIKKRVYDLAACNSNVKIYFNGDLIKINKFETYVGMYKNDFFYETKRGSDWEIAVALSEEGFQQVSFANSTETYDGGTHVDYIMAQIVLEMRKYFKKKHKVDVKPSELKRHMFLFLNATVINPSFSSQTKEKLITESKEFGKEFEVSDKFIKKLLKSEIVDSVLDWIERKKNAKENKIQRDLNKKLSKIKVDKLIDSKGKKRLNHSLGIFEGDCLEENTKIKVLDGSKIVDKKIMDVQIGDVVITHKNRFSLVNAKTEKISKRNIIRTKDLNINCSGDHKWFVYDYINNRFYFEKTNLINKNKHKLVKNHLAFTESLLLIDKIEGDVITMESGQEMVVSDEHKFAVCDRATSEFYMCSKSELDTDLHAIVNTFKI